MSVRTAKSTTDSVPKSSSHKHSLNASTKYQDAHTDFQWPEISDHQRDTIIELLLELLSPIGEYKSKYVVASKGKRAKKRKRDTKPEGGDVPNTSEPNPPRPQIEGSIIVGRNAVTRHLERMRDEEDSGGTSTKDLCSVVFLTQPTDFALYRHLPVQTSVIAKTHPKWPLIRVVPLHGKSVEADIANALGIARVGALGVYANAPGGAALLQYVHENISAVQVPWVSPVQPQ